MWKIEYELKTSDDKRNFLFLGSSELKIYVVFKRRTVIMINITHHIWSIYISYVSGHKWSYLPKYIQRIDKADKIFSYFFSEYPLTDFYVESTNQRIMSCRDYDPIHLEITIHRSETISNHSSSEWKRRFRWEIYRLNVRLGGHSYHVRNFTITTRGLWLNKSVTWPYSKRHHFNIS